MNRYCRRNVELLVGRGEAIDHLSQVTIWKGAIAPRVLDRVPISWSSENPFLFSKEMSLSDSFLLCVCINLSFVVEMLTCLNHSSLFTKPRRVRGTFPVIHGEVEFCIVYHSICCLRRCFFDDLMSPSNL